jgi:hypothetical protein
MTPERRRNRWGRILRERQQEVNEARQALAFAVEAAHADGLSLRELGAALYVSHQTARRMLDHAA